MRSDLSGSALSFLSPALHLGKESRFLPPRGVESSPTHCIFSLFVESVGERVDSPPILPPRSLVFIICMSPSFLYHFSHFLTPLLAFPLVKTRGNDFPMFNNLGTFFYYFSFLPSRTYRNIIASISLILWSTLTLKN